MSIAAKKRLWLQTGPTPDPSRHQRERSGLTACLAARGAAGKSNGEQARYIWWRIS